MTAPSKVREVPRASERTSGVGPGAAPDSRVSHSRRRRRSGIVSHLILIGLGLSWVYPLLWALSGSLDTKMGMFAGGPSLLLHATPQWQNYATAWGEAKFGQYFLNSVTIAFFVVILTVLFTSMAGYALARYHFPGRKVIMVAVAVTMFLPRGYTLIPIYDLVTGLGLLNTIWAIIVVQVSSTLIFSTFLFVGYFMSASKELEEAARIDGAGYNKTFFYVMFPTAKPMIATVGLFSFIGSWNDFIIPLVFTLGNPKLRTVPVGMASMVGGASGTDWPVLSAASVISLLPIVIVFIVAQRYIVDAFAGAVKG